MPENVPQQDEEDKPVPLMLNHDMDTRRWTRVKTRPDHVLIGTYGRSGTTWMQTIVSKVLDIPSDANVHEVSPWVEWPILPIEQLDALNAQTHRRFVKHHLAREYLPPHVREKTAQIYVARDACDVVLSLYNLHSSFTDQNIVTALIRCLL